MNVQLFNKASDYAVKPACKVEEIQQRIVTLDERIDHWKRIAERERVDISKEQEFLGRLSNTNQKAASESQKIFQLLLIEKWKEEASNRIFKKIDSDIKRDVSEPVLDRVKMDVVQLVMNKVRPWLQIAESLSAPIEEEKTIIFSAYQSSYEQLSSLGPRPLHAREIIQRRLKVIGNFMCSKIILKCYQQRIQQRAEQIKSQDWFNDEKVEKIDGIQQDALSSLPASAAVEEMEKECAAVYRLFEDNLYPMEHHPSIYELLADREWLKREIKSLAAKYFHDAMARRDLANAYDVRQLCVQALALLKDGKSTQEITGVVKECFEIIAERIYNRSKCA